MPLKLAWVSHCLSWKAGGKKERKVLVRSTTVAYFNLFVQTLHIRHRQKQATPGHDGINSELLWADLSYSREFCNGSQWVTPSHCVVPPTLTLNLAVWLASANWASAHVLQHTGICPLGMLPLPREEMGLDSWRMKGHMQGEAQMVQPVPGSSWPAWVSPGKIRRITIQQSHRPTRNSKVLSSNVAKFGVFCYAAKDGYKLETSDQRTNNF